MKIYIYNIIALVALTGTAHSVNPFKLNQGPEFHSSVKQETFSLKSQALIFQKGLKALQKNQTASPFFFEFLKKEPLSSAGLFNLGFSFYQEGKESLAKAFWRQALFQNPYDPRLRTALKKVGDKSYFWLWIPEDLVWGLMAIAFFILSLCIWHFRPHQSLNKEKSKVQDQAFFWLFVRKNWFSVFFCSFCFIVGSFYFYVRLKPYHTLTEEALLFSAPDPQAPTLLELEKGRVILKIKDLSKEWQKARLLEGPTGWLKKTVPAKEHKQAQQNDLYKPPKLIPFNPAKQS